LGARARAGVRSRASFRVRTRDLTSVDDFTKSSQSLMNNRRLPLE